MGRPGQSGRRDPGRSPIGIAALQVSRDGRTLYTAGLDGAILVWDLVGTRRLGRPVEAGGPNRARSTLSHDGRRLATGHADGTIVVVDLGEPARSRRFAVVPGGGAVAGLRFVPGSRLAVVLGPNEFTALVDTETGRVVRTLERRLGSDYDTESVTPGMSADGSLLATPKGTLGGTIEVALGSAEWPSRRPAAAGRSRDSRRAVEPRRRLATVALANGGHEGGSIEAWDVRTRRRVQRLDFAGLPVFARFSPNGKLFAVGNRSGETRIYKTATFKPITRVLAGDAGGIRGAAITPNNRTLATGSETGAVQLWDIPSGQALGAPLPGVPSSGVIPAFTPDGATLVAIYASGRAYLWDIRPASLGRHACRVAGRRLTRAEWDEFLPGREYAPAC